MASKTAYLALMTFAMYPLPQILVPLVHSQAQKYNLYAWLRNKLTSSDLQGH